MTTSQIPGPLAAGRFLRTAALLLLVGIVGVWIALGAHTGWTRTLDPITKIDPVTEIEYTEYEKRFVPGIDFLGGGLAASAALLGVAIVLSKTHKSRTS